MSTTTPALAIEARDIARRFGARWVLRGVTLQLAAGEIVGLLGANGSGKSTLLRILATLLRPHAGRARVGGFDSVLEGDDVRGLIGFLAHTPGLYDDLTARENLAFASMMRGGTPDGRDARVAVDRALERVGLTVVANDRVRGFSAGMQRRLALARLLLAEPLVLLLDEPYSNLDSDGIALVNEVIRGCAQAGGAALLVLHERAPAAALLGRTVTLADGRLQ